MVHGLIHVWRITNEVGKCSTLKRLQLLDTNEPEVREGFSEQIVQCLRNSDFRLTELRIDGVIRLWSVDGTLL